MKLKNWIKPILIVSTLFTLGWLLPAKAVDPWNLFSPKKIVNLIFALAFVQAIGSVLISQFGSKIGAIVAGFLSGLVSSTATTASLARRSRSSIGSEVPAEVLTFLSATLAMLIEALAITMYGTIEIHGSLLIIFSGPLLSTIIMMIYQGKHTTSHLMKIDDTQLKILPLLKLAAFVLVLLTLSKILQSVFGHAGLLALTFIISLFEIHGSVIANLQMHDSGVFDVQFLGGLLAASIAASYCSKLFLVWTLGSSSLKTSVLKTTLILFASLILSDGAFSLI